MVRTAMLVAVLVSFPVVAHGVPLPRDVIPDVPSLEGTEWSGEQHGIPFTYRFDKDGVLRYFAAGDSTSKGMWKQNKEQVEFDINDYSFHKAAVRGDWMEGTSSNKDGLMWVFRISRVKKTGKAPADGR